MTTLDIYTDGSCNNNSNHKIGGYSCIIQINNSSREIITGGEVKSTSARMELAAVQACLLYANRKHKEVQLNIFTDAQYISNSINKGWIYDWVRMKYSNTKNADLWRTIVIQLSLENITRFTITHVKGHSGIPLNEMADQYAEEARRKMETKWHTRNIRCFNEHTDGFRRTISDNEL